MSKEGKYIYGFISLPEESERELFAGIDEDLDLLEVDGIAAVTEDDEVVDLFSLDNKQIAWKLVEHQKIIEKIMNVGISIVPMKLGSYLKDIAEVKKLLQKEHQLVKGVIDKIKDKVEFDVVACWSDFPAVLKGIGDIQEIKDFRSQLMADPENITPEQRMKIGVMVAKALEQKKNCYALKIVNSLKEACISAAQNEVMNDEMLLNTAFMMDRGQIINFENILDRLDNEFDNKLKFKCIGPLPCYNFYTLEILNVDAKNIDRAVGLLQLGKEADLTQIKSAYKAKAMKLHPDKNQNADADKFNELNKAYLLLSSYCKAFAIEGLCSFSKDKILNNTKILKLKD